MNDVDIGQLLLHALAEKHIMWCMCVWTAWLVSQAVSKPVRLTMQRRAPVSTGASRRLTGRMRQRDILAATCPVWYFYFHPCGVVLARALE